MIGVLIFFFLFIAIILSISGIAYKIEQSKKEKYKKYTTPLSGSDTPTAVSNTLDETVLKMFQDASKEIAIPSLNPNQEFKGVYQKCYLLSKNEYYEFKKLREICDCKELIICPKVRLLDLVRPINGVEKYKTLFYKVQSKHVDFVLCDKNLYVQAILEIDDGSHKEPGRKERDEFVDFVLKDVGYKVIRVASVTPEALSNI